MSAQPDTPFTVVVEIRDPDGDVCANGEADVPCIISIDTFPSGSEDAVLSGTLIKVPSAGVLTFDDLQIDLEGNGYKLKIETVDPIDDDASLAPLVSGTFSVAGMILTADPIPPTTTEVQYGYNGAVGDLVPDSYSGNTITLMFAGTDRHGNPVSGITMSGSVAQSVFTSITINGVTLTSASALYTDSVSSTSWVWGTAWFSAADTYEVTFA